MIDIFLSGGSFLGACMSYEFFSAIMTDDFLGADDFIKVKLADGTRVAVRKGDVCAFCESTDS